jgi:hypothetical protein
MLLTKPLLLLTKPLLLLTKPARYAPRTYAGDADASIRQHTLTTRSGPLTYADVCWRMLTYADVC